jgi:hypothetical protein
VLRPTAKPTVNNVTVADTSVQRMISPNLTNITNNQYQCGAQFLEKDFQGVVDKNDPVPTKLV